MSKQLTIEQASILEWLDNTDDYSPRSRSAIDIMCRDGLMEFSMGAVRYVATSKGMIALEAYRETYPTKTGKSIHELQNTIEDLLVELAAERKSWVELEVLFKKQNTLVEKLQVNHAASDLVGNVIDAIMLQTFDKLEAYEAFIAAFDLLIEGYDCGDGDYINDQWRALKSEHAPQNKSAAK